MAAGTVVESNVEVLDSVDICRPIDLTLCCFKQGLRYQFDYFGETEAV